MMVDFFYVLDENFSHFLELGLRAIRHFHPDSRTYIYDVSPYRSEKIARIAQDFPGATVIYWPEEQWFQLPFINDIDFGYFYPHWNLGQEVKYRIRRFRTVALRQQKKEDWIVDKNEWLALQKRKIKIWAQKSACALDCMQRGARSLVFLDADAIPIANISSVFNADFDVALTLRDLDEVKIGLDPGVRTMTPIPYHAINAGVMFFRYGDSSRNFVGVWQEQMKNVSYHMVEQTALSQLCLSADKDAFSEYRRKFTLSLRGGEYAKLLILPCREFNNTYIEDDFIIPEGVKVAHFKGYLHKDKYFKSLVQAVNNILVKDGGHQAIASTKFREIR